MRNKEGALQAPCPACKGDGLAKVASDIIPAMAIPESTVCTKCDGKGFVTNGS